jgi:hypothetical protein
VRQRTLRKRKLSERSYKVERREPAPVFNITR